MLLFIVESARTGEDDFANGDQINDCDVFFAYQPPQFRKRDVFIKITVISLLFVGVIVSAGARFYF